MNALRVTLHPDGMAPRIRNLPEWRAHLLDRLRRQVTLTSDDRLAALYAELSDYPGGEESLPAHEPGIAVPLRVRVAGTELAFFSTIATFGTAVDITLAELAIEAFFPADEATSDYLLNATGLRAPLARAREATRTAPRSCRSPAGAARRPCR